MLIQLTRNPQRKLSSNSKSKASAKTNTSSFYEQTIDDRSFLSEDDSLIDIVIEHPSIEAMFNDEQYLVIIELLHKKRNENLLNAIYMKCNEGLLITTYGKEIIIAMIAMNNILVMNTILYFVIKYIDQYISNSNFIKIISALYSMQSDFVLQELSKVLKL